MGRSGARRISDFEVGHLYRDPRTRQMSNKLVHPNPLKFIESVPDQYLVFEDEVTGERYRFFKSEWRDAFSHLGPSKALVREWFTVGAKGDGDDEG